MSIEKLQQLHAQKAYAQAAKPRPNGAKKEESPFEDFAEKGLLQDIQPQPKENRDIVDFSQKERERLEFLKMMEEKRAAENAKTGLSVCDSLMCAPSNAARDRKSVV